MLIAIITMYVVVVGVITYILHQHVEEELQAKLDEEGYCLNISHRAPARLYECE